MLRKIAFMIAGLTTVWSVPAASQAEHQDASVIRTIWGVRFEVPAGWDWVVFDGTIVVIEHIATKSGPKGEEKSPNQFAMFEAKIFDFDNHWDRVDRDERRSFPNGATARWRLGAPDRFLYVFQGEIRLGSKVLYAELLDQSPRFDMSIVETAFLQIAATMRDVPKSAVIYHPHSRFAAHMLDTLSWDSRLNNKDVMIFKCHATPEGCGEGSATWIYVYQSKKVYSDTRAAMDSLGKTMSFGGVRPKIGDVRHVDMEGGDVMWAEHVGDRWPFLGVVNRDGRYYIVDILLGRSNTRTNDALRPDFLAVAKSVRSWDGK